MAPSKGKQGKKGGKLSKAEKERLKAEEAERKAKEEEQARLAAEQAELERIEKEKLEKEERRRLEEQERIRHQAEIDELSNILHENNRKLNEMQISDIQQRKWLDYVECNGRPDPTCQKEINTFQSLWRDEEMPAAADLVKECEDALLLEHAIRHLAENKEDEATKMLRTNMCKEICECILSKLSSLSQNILQNPATNLDPDTMNLHFQHESSNVAVSIWGNTAKNPRAKSIDFTSPMLSMELPKALVLADAALRVLHVSFDLFSPQCSTYSPPRVIEKEEQEQEIEAVDSTDAVENEQSKQDLALVESGESKLNETDLELNDSLVTTMENIEPEPTNEMNADDSSDDLDESIVDLRAFSVAGSIIYMELFQLPPQPKACKGWTIQQALLSDLRPYHLAIQSSTVKEATEMASQLSDERETSNVSDQKTKSQLEIDIKSTSDPIKVKMSLPKGVAFFETPIIARWDATTTHWLQDEFEDLVYDEEERFLEFKVCQFGPMAIFQDLYINMPFQNWELVPRGPNHCTFNLAAAMVELEIEIKDDKCRLVSVCETDCLDQVVGTWMAVDQLLEVCRSHGVNVSPNSDGKKYVAVTEKDTALVCGVYNCMALLSTSFAMRWSKWSAECPHDAVVIQACNAIENLSPSENAFSLYMTTTRISCELAMTENSEEFSSDMKEGHQMHPNLFHMLLDGASSSCRSRIETSSSHFTNAVYTMLEATNPVIFS